ncbi:hypothetical protein F0P96_03305 [Hymenobacter busanensis]|uniref:Uncharacterized protein n=1 Tax=Hymenobacter busanensis TaxID=2607656 RepID=A0A7L4ZTY3_9BACT|nr:hypothetical protein [Hymenobacter busanensis]KAA9339654.1 hypothetical protein F0P96_03305 [Hymenobacter busanensis]QHJ06591.1 hypothetical protein GUY19_04445 [Hymenobacter busanensis]
MRLHDLYNDDEHLYCSIQFDAANQWLYATWQGYVPTPDAERGAEAYLTELRQRHCPGLLNDNSRIAGPWFDSTAWLEQIWAPQAAELGLRYVAHVTPPDGFAASLDVAARRPFGTQFELQIFDDLTAAQDWLLRCYAAEKTPHRLA